MGPIPLEAGQTKVIYGAVCAAPDASAAALRCHELLTQRSDWEHVWQQASASLAAPPALPAAESLALGQQLMNAVSAPTLCIRCTRGDSISVTTLPDAGGTVSTHGIPDSLEWVWLRPAYAMPLTA